MRTNLFALLAGVLASCSLLTLLSLGAAPETAGRAGRPPPLGAAPRLGTAPARAEKPPPPADLYARMRGDDGQARSDASATADVSAPDAAAAPDAAPPTPPTTSTAAVNASCAAGVVALTYASHRGKDDRFCRSLESAVRNHVDLHVLGWQVPWEGLSQKLGAALAAVEALPPTCVVMFTDAYDVLYTETSRVMRLKFDALGAPLLFSGECGCWPQVTYDKGATCRDKYPHSPTPYRYLNSGSWMGRAGVAARFLRTIVDEASRGKSGASFHKLNDQELASDLYFRGTFGPELRLDHFAQLFQAMHAVRDKSAVPDCDPWPALTATDGVYRNSVTHSRPSVYHFNGGGKRHHLNMEQEMWWKRCSEANSATAVDEVEQTRMRFGADMRTFDEICPGHLAATRSSAQRECGAELVRGLAGA